MQLHVNLWLSLFTLALSIICISGIGLIAAGIIMVTKRGEPITWTFSTLSGFLSGVIFPISVLPGWLQKVSAILPPTYALSALRKALIIDATFNDVRGDVTILALMSSITIPLGIFVFRWGFNKARRDGTLVEY
jgi:ABC-2 type transport system permease protein